LWNPTLAHRTREDGAPGVHFFEIDLFLGAFGDSIGYGVPSPKMAEESKHTPSHHSTKWHKNHPEAVRSEPPKPKVTPVSKPPSVPMKLAYYLEKAGVVSLLLAIGAMLMESMFWWFVGLVLLALVLSIFAALIDRSHGRSRYVFAMFFLIVAAIFVWKIVIGTVFPEITAEWTDGNYAEGTNVNGLNWRGDWSHLTVSIFNNSNVDLKDVDIELSVDQWVAGIKVDGNPNCSVIAGGRKPIITARDPRTENQQIIASPGERAPHRLLCDKLPAATVARVVAGLINDRGANHSKMIPASVHFRALYKAGPRPYNWKGETTPSRY